MAFNMATTTLRPLRVFRNFYLCDECPNEWTDEMLTVSHSWCPCCDKQCEPYDSVAFIEECEDEEECE